MTQMKKIKERKRPLYFYFFWEVTNDKNEKKNIEL